MYKTIQKYWPKDKDLPERAFTLEMRKRVLDGELYDRHRHPFHYEMNDSGEYVPLRERRPSVRNNLCRTVVDDSVSLLFSEGRFPSIELQDAQQKAALHRLIKEMRLNEVMIDSATHGAVGSAAILLRVLEGRVFLNVIDTAYLTPQWNPNEPDTLQSVIEKRKVDGKSLQDAGYAIAGEDLATIFWFQREWDASAERWYLPCKISDADALPVIDELKTVEHQLGFVPLVWIKNLPGGDGIDGKCTFPDEAIDTQIEIDYQLSQAGRGLKFMSDPTLVIRNEASSGAPMVKGAANAIMVGQDGDAKLLEISGESTSAVMAYVTHLREVALEAMHGNRASNEKLSAAQSGRALELLNQALVWLADRLRISSNNQAGGAGGAGIYNINTVGETAGGGGAPGSPYGIGGVGGSATSTGTSANCAAGGGGSFYGYSGASVNVTSSGYQLGGGAGQGGAASGSTGGVNMLGLSNGASVDGQYRIGSASGASSNSVYFGFDSLFDPWRSLTGTVGGSGYAAAITTAVGFGGGQGGSGGGGTIATNGAVYFAGGGGVCTYGGSFAASGSNITFGGGSGGVVSLNTANTGAGGNAIASIERIK